MRAVIYAIEKDRLIKYAENVLEGIQFKIGPNEESHKADFNLINSTKNNHIKMFMGMSIGPIVQAMQEFEKKNKYKSRKLLKYISHEIVHYLDSENIADFVLKVFKLFNEDMRLSMTIPPELSSSGIDAVELVTKMNFTNLNLFITRCRVEGIARYREREFTQQHRILAKMAREEWRKMVMLFAYKDVSSDNIMELSGSTLPYNIGEHMCVMISLGILAKKRGGEVRLIANNQAYPLGYLNELFSKTDVFYITRIPEDVWEHTLEIVARQNPEGFVRVYNAACNRLKLENENRVIDWETYIQVKNILIRSSEAIKAVLRKQGYDM